MDNSSRVKYITTTFTRPTTAAHPQQGGEPHYAYDPCFHCFPRTEELVACTAQAVPGILARLLPSDMDHCIRIGQDSAAANSIVFKLSGPWTHLLGIWRIQGRNLVTSTASQQPQPSVVLAKVQFITSVSHEEHCVSEDMCHRAVSEDDGLGGGGRCCPRFILGATIEYRDVGTVRVTLMEYVQGAQLLSSVMDPGGEAARAWGPRRHLAVLLRVRARISTIIRRMWALGVVHCDLHEHNVLLRPRDRSADAGADADADADGGGEEFDVYMIDFGHSVMLPSDLKFKLKQRLQRSVSDGAGAGRRLTDAGKGDQAADSSSEGLCCAFSAVAMPFIRNVQLARGFDYGHLDTAFLRMFDEHIRLLMLRQPPAGCCG